LKPTPPAERLDISYEALRATLNKHINSGTTDCREILAHLISIAEQEHRAKDSQ
jgi:hypothetical protein